MKRGFFDRKFNKAENESTGIRHEASTLSQFGGAGLINNHFSNSEFEVNFALPTQMATAWLIMRKLKRP